VKPKWFPNWSQDICIIVASGPSAKNADLYSAIGRARFVVVNNSWQLAPWSDFLFAADYKWWASCNGCTEFKGWKVTTDRRAAETHEWGLLRLIARLADDRLQTDDGTVGWGGNSGFQALNMVVNFGCRKIILVGYDMTTKFGLHWHDPYPGTENPTPNKTLRWQRSLDGAAKTLVGLGITVVNCSQESHLRKFKKMDFLAAMRSFLA
jgi:hypothetical protein